MESLTRLVSESLARHGFDRPLDYRRLQWSRWFRCESHHSLLSVPSKPGVFALAEEVMDFAPRTGLAEAAAPDVPPTLSDAMGSGPVPALEDRRFSACPELVVRAASGATHGTPALAAEPTDAAGPRLAASSRRMLAVSRFCEDDDMAFVLDRMLSYQNPMCARLKSGRYFVRYVVIEEPSQRRSICAALNQWIVSSSERAAGIGAHFASSLELTEHSPGPKPSSTAEAVRAQVETSAQPALSGVEGCTPPRHNETARGTLRDGIAQNHAATAPQLDSGAATNIHCPSPFPSGF